MTPCIHCGTPFSPTPSLTDFCCRGCEFVHGLIHDEGLDRFYDLRRDSALRPARSVPFDRHDFSWLDSTVTKAEEKTSASGVAEAEFSVEGLSCVGCVWLVESLFDRFPGSVDASAHPATARLILRWQPGKADLAHFAQELTSFGYTLTARKAGQPNSECQSLAGKLGLCGAFALNAMVFTLPRYFGMPEDFAFAGIFQLVTLLSATLSMLVGGSYFIKRAWQAAKVNTIHIDLPIALGIIAAYLGSLYGWVAGVKDLLYFDFVATFIFLMLGGRYLQLATVEKNRSRLHRSRPVAESFDDPHSPTPIPLEDLAPDRQFQIHPGQSSPVCGVLETEAADFSLEWINGEAEPQTFRAGRQVPAGAILLGPSETIVKATETWENSLLARLIAPPVSIRRSGAVEKVLRVYLLTIIVVGLAGFAWWAITESLPTALQVMISVFVVSCPCAIGVALPLADEFAAAKMQRAGVFIRDVLLWPRLRAIKTIIFDKTGTLTLERPVLTNPEALENLPEPAAAALARLVDGNLHPVARSLSEALSKRGRDLLRTASPEKVEELAGKGRTITLDRKTWSLGRPGWASGHTISDDGHDAELTCEKSVVARFRFQESLRPEAVETLAHLRKSGFRQIILSGDRQEKVTTVARELGIPAEDAKAGLTPEEKERLVREIDQHDTLYLGDGANDSLAFDAACATGTPVIDQSLLESKADFYFFGKGVQFLPVLFQVAARRRRAVRSTFIFTGFYNIVAGGCALAGWMNPLVAAIIMPLSAAISVTQISARLKR